MEPGKALISIGALLLAVGLVLNYAPWLVSWFGKLPGDIRIQSKSSFVFIPITSMIVASVLITVLANLFFRK
ncbi:MULTISPECIES: DUF2905 domain-containing protein [Methylomonas]|uniref:DUF2905 domain-containing protein n=1 Tax=Methylomonas TaxID=416 RepID=UPI0006CFF7A5|nr:MULTISPECIES: DUF2905 domain-containing protein [Methylomonas]ANE56439.1 hypothetical protein AYM39_15465 [Methylomonas sp. DH-1]BBL57622.1 hypothetical protein MKFW12EY_12350 [Methylomonas koyamae]